MVRKYFGFIVLFVLAFIPLLPLFHSGLPLTHDGQDHVARIANFYQSLSEGNFFPRWAGNLNWGYGHPVMMFLYPLSSYSASVFHFIGFSLVDSVKLVFGVAFILSGFFMYKWLREFLGEYPSILGAVLYLYAPYRFVDLYVRGAIGEHVAFIFPPLFCYFLLKIAKSKKNIQFYFGMASISFAGLILAHNAITIMFLPFFMFYCIYLIFESKKNGRLLFLKFASVALLGVGLSAFFLLPAFFEGKYTLRDIVTGGEVLKRFVTFNQLVYGPWSYGGTGSFTVQLGLVTWITIIFGPITLYKLFKSKSKFLVLYIISATFLILSAFLMIQVSEAVWKNFSTLQKFQFPWRFLSLSVFSSAIIAAISLEYFYKNYQKWILATVILYLFLFTGRYWQPQDYLSKPESFYKSVYNGTTDTGESSPVWSVRFMEKRPLEPAEVIEGKGEIKQIFRSSTKHSYEVNSEYGFRMRENTVYFPGWKVYINGKEYKGIQFQDPKSRGLITFYVLAGKYMVDVKFEDTKLRQISNIVSLISVGILGGLYIYIVLRKKI